MDACRTGHQPRAAGSRARALWAQERPVAQRARVGPVGLPGTAGPGGGRSVDGPAHRLHHQLAPPASPSTLSQQLPGPHRPAGSLAKPPVRPPSRPLSTSAQMPQVDTLPGAPACDGHACAGVPILAPRPFTERGPHPSAPGSRTRRQGCGWCMDAPARPVGLALGGPLGASWALQVLSRAPGQVLPSSEATMTPDMAQGPLGTASPGWLCCCTAPRQLPAYLPHAAALPREVTSCSPPRWPGSREPPLMPPWLVLALWPP